MAVKVQIIGGAFQDIYGNPLANGYLIFQLSQDAQVNGNKEICAGYKVKVPLDANGNIVTNPANYAWPNNVLTPATTFYYVSAYTAQGQLVWGTSYQLVSSSPSPFDISVWVP